MTGEPGPADGPSAYADFQVGLALLDDGNPHAAAVALERALALEPAKASIREALARAYFGSGRFARAAVEFRAAVDLDPVNDYAHFGLGLSLSRSGDPAGARRHLRLAVAMRPDRADYVAALDALSVP